MIKLERPLLSAQDVFTSCISLIRNPALKQRLKAVTQDIVDASQEFDAAAAENRLHQIAQQSMIRGNVSREEMGDVYTMRMAKSGAPGRAAYDALLMSPPQGICPLCAHRIVSTLDHHLPKSRYPALAVTPLNLVPACIDCNKAKLSNLPTTACQETLHPYYDDISRDRWLYAEVRQTNPASLNFFVTAPAHWSPILEERVHLHFRTFGLAVFYALLAADELQNIRHQLGLIYPKGRADGVRAQLEMSAISYGKNRLNGWSAVTFEALAASDWYCNGGFR